MKINKILIFSAAIVAILLIGVFIGQRKTVNLVSDPNIVHEQEDETIPEPQPPKDLNQKILVLKNIIMKDGYFKPTETIRECVAGDKTYFISGTNSYTDGQDGYYSSSGTFLGVCGGRMTADNFAAGPEVCKIKFDSCVKILAPIEKGYNMYPDQPAVDIYNLK